MRLLLAPAGTAAGLGPERSASPSWTDTRLDQTSILFSYGKWRSRIAPLFPHHRFPRHRECRAPRPDGAAPGVPLTEHRTFYQKLADTGYTHVWSTESAGTDAFSPLLLAAACEPRLTVGAASPRCSARARRCSRSRPQLWPSRPRARWSASTRRRRLREQLELGRLLPALQAHGRHAYRVLIPLASLHQVRPPGHARAGKGGPPVAAAAGPSNAHTAHS